MNTYLAERKEGNIEFTQGYDAESWHDAEIIANKRGWGLVYYIPEEEVAI